MTKPDDPPKGVGDGTMRAAIASVAISGVALAFGTFAIFGVGAALGVIVGGALATANLYVFARLGKAFLSPEGRAGPWAAIAVLKLVFLFGGVYMLMKSGLVSGAALAAGYAALPMGITLGALLGPKPPEEPEEPDHDGAASGPKPRSPLGPEA